MHYPAKPALQEGYARFGWHLGMIAQLVNDVVGIAADAAGKTDLTLKRPTLPLTYAARYLPAADIDTNDAAIRSALWANGPAHLTWAVAETYRAQALSLVPTLTADAVSRARLTALLPKLYWVNPKAAGIWLREQ